MLAQARRGGERLVVADAERLALRAGAVHAVVSLRFLFHVDSDEARRAILDEMRRAARVCVLGQVRYRATLKQALRYARHKLKLGSRYRPSLSRADIAGELAAVGLELVEVKRVSLLFSDKAIFLARVPAG